MNKKPSQTDPLPLTGQLLIAMPQMQDPRFQHAVIFICGHDENGAMGLVINKLVDDITLVDLMSQLELEGPKKEHDQTVHFGGPVEVGRGFVLHTDDYLHESSVKIAEGFALTATLEILVDISRGKGPKKNIVALGYAGWGAGQLENELQKNTWLQVESDTGLVFSEDLTQCWHKSLAKIGIDPDLLSMDPGHA